MPEKESFDKRWVEFTETFNRDYPTFHRNLFDHSPYLTRQDTRIAKLIKAGFSTEQIADFLDVGKTSVHMARHRLREHLGLDALVDLTTFLQSM
jgi:FixJ family two-component response regulator